MCFNYYLPEAVLQNLHVNFSPTSVGMDIILVKKLLEHPGLHKLLQQLKRKSQKTLISVRHNMEKAHHVVEQMKRDGANHWWENLLGWSPTATGFFNLRLHPAVVILALAGIGFVLVTAVYVRVWYLIQQSRKWTRPEIQRLKEGKAMCLFCQNQMLCFIS